MRGDIKNRLDHLRSQSSRSKTSLVSMYIPGRTNLVYLTNMVSSEISKANNIKCKHTRNGVKTSLNSILYTLKNIKVIPSNGMVMFSGETMDGYVTESLTPVRSINDFMYKCDNKFHV